MSNAFSESDLYLPICHFLEEAGWKVQAEVKHCDIAAEKDGVLLVVELKKAFGLKLVYQAMDRQSISDDVYVAIPRPQKGQREKSWKDMLRLLRRLGIGLMTVALDSPIQTVEVILLPGENTARKNNKKRSMLQKELQNRHVSANIGGITRHKIMTAYREKSLELCCILEQKQTVSYDFLRQLGLDEKYMSILRNNVYHWYQRVQRGVYALSSEGSAALLVSEHTAIVTYYRKQYAYLSDTEKR